MKIDFKKEIVLDGGVKAQLEGKVLRLKGPKGEIEREFPHPKIKIEIEEGKIRVLSPQGTKKEKTVLGSYVAHIRNMVAGVNEVHVYKLKICSGHFPMNVTLSGNDFVIKNFFGETVPRKITLPKGVEVKINGTEIVVSSADKELAGLTASRIENMCRITNRDIRIFQDGCYIVEKAGRSS